MSAALQPDRAIVAEFVGTLFRYADPMGYISLRSFNDIEDGKPPIGIEAIKVGAPDLVDRICARITEAATRPEPHVFCPPVCTFRSATGATAENLAEGIALTVECDANARAAYERLTAALGVKPTATVASGGKWLNPASGKYEPKLHLHWRLKQPTRTAEEHAQLREARVLAAELVDADRSAVAIVHPI